MAENYDLIFGQSASQQYAWSDSDYQNGWQTVGSTPPTAEQFDALQRRSDTKAQDLNNRLSPIEEKSEADGRQAATAYTAGAMLTVDGLPNGWLLQCIVPGTSGTDAITLPDTLIDGLTIIDGDVTWALRKVATNGGLGYRQPSTAYTVGNIAYHSALPTGWYLECTVEGITDSGELTISSPAVGGTVSDGTVTWTIMKNLPLSGGAMTGTSITRNVDNSGLQLCGGTEYNHGACLVLYGQNRPADSSEFYLQARNETTQKNLVGNTLGGLKWDNNDLAGSAIVSKSLGTNGYIKYASGLILQWGIVTPEPAITFSLPISYSNSYRAFTQIQNGSNDFTVTNCAPISNSQLRVATQTVATGGRAVNWFTIGY